MSHFLSEIEIEHLILRPPSPGDEKSLNQAIGCSLPAGALNMNFKAVNQLFIEC